MERKTDSSSPKTVLNVSTFCRKLFMICKMIRIMFGSYCPHVSPTWGLIQVGKKISITKYCYEFRKLLQTNRNHDYYGYNDKLFIIAENGQMCYLVSRNDWDWKLLIVSRWAHVESIHFFFRFSFIVFILLHFNFKVINFFADTAKS